MPLSEQFQEYEALTAQILKRLPGLALYNTGEGGSVGECLFQELAQPDKVAFVNGEELRGLWPGAAGQRVAEFQQGREFKVHVHFAVDATACTEVVTCTGGLMQVQIIGREPQLLGPGDSIRMAPGEDHRAFAVTDCSCVGITVPACAGYPEPEGEHGPDRIEPGGRFAEVGDTGIGVGEDARDADSSAAVPSGATTNRHD